MNNNWRTLLIMKGPLQLRVKSSTSRVHLSHRSKEAISPLSIPTRKLGSFPSWSSSSPAWMDQGWGTSSPSSTLCLKDDPGPCLYSWTKRTFDFLSHHILYWLSIPSVDSNFSGSYNNLDKSMLQVDTILWWEDQLICAMPDKHCKSLRLAL